MHRVLVETVPERAGETLSVEGDEARHALRVKRVREGEAVELLDGRGGVAAGVVIGAGARQARDDGVLRVRVESVRHVKPARPRVEVWSAVPKGSRADEMIDQLAQAGAAQWCALETARGVVDPRETKLERLERIAREASKQCGRAWVMEIGGKRTLAEALRGDAGVRVVVADAGGEVWRADPAKGTVRLFIGPEGGWTDEEVAQARAAGAGLARFGPHTMRVETAGVVGCGVVMGEA